MAKSEALKNFSGYCPVNKCPESFSVTYVERDDGMWERRDKKDCRFRGLFNPMACRDKSKCELLSSVKDVITADELDGEPVEEYHLFDKLAALQAKKSD